MIKDYIMHKREKIIEKRCYSLLLPPVRQAMPLCTRVAVLAGPVVAILGTDIGKGGMDKFATALAGVDAIQLDRLVMDAVYASKLSCNKEPISTEIDFERHFSDLRKEVYQVTLWVLWETVKDFFPQVSIFTQTLKDKFDKEFQSQKLGETTTG